MVPRSQSICICKNALSRCQSHGAGHWNICFNCHRLTGRGSASMSSKHVALTFIITVDLNRVSTARLVSSGLCSDKSSEDNYWTHCVAWIGWLGKTKESEKLNSQRVAAFKLNDCVTVIARGFIELVPILPILAVHIEQSRIHTASMYKICKCELT